MNQMRILFFFDGTKVVVVSHALLKKSQKTPSPEITRAVQAMNEYRIDPRKHSKPQSERT